MKSTITFAPWDYKEFKPDCLFCTKDASICAVANKGKNMVAQIRFCGDPICQERACATALLALEDIGVGVRQSLANYEEAAVEWMRIYCKEHKIEWNKLSLGERTLLTAEVPCRIRCWRVGGPVDVRPGEPCPECGHHIPKRTMWDRVQNPEI